MICGMGFCNYDCASDMPQALSTFESVSISGAIFDGIDVSRVGGAARDFFPTSWDANTLLHADFNGNVYAGNIEYSTNVVTSMQVRRREVGTTDWMTIGDIPINTSEDFNFVLLDRLNRSGVEYEYALLPMMNTIEGPIVTKLVWSEFEGVALYDGLELFYSVMDVNNDMSRTQIDSRVQTMGCKFPTYMKYNRINYSEGKCTAYFLPRDYSWCGFTTEGAFDYRESLVDFLTNGNAKVMKDAYGHIWIVQISGEVTYTNSEHPELVRTSFNWVQIGDAKSSQDTQEFVLYKGGREATT